MKRLVSDYEALRTLAAAHPRVKIQGVGGNPPDRYRIQLSVRSLREAGGSLTAVSEHTLEIVLPAGYPRDAPLCRMLTPVFHPNIAPHAVCIGDHWTAAESLDLMVQRVGEMLAYQSYNVKSPLNGRAARWAEENAGKLPLDPVPFFVDLNEAAPAAAGCSNCAVSGVPLKSCGAGHELCPQCDATCPGCSATLCLPCGRTRCKSCASGACANCGAPSAALPACAALHRLCADCSAGCPKCGRGLCILCGEYPCRSCG